MRQAIEAAPVLADELTDPPPPALLAGRAQPALAADAAAGLDLILEGFLLHHRRPRMLLVTDRDRRVVAGDYCYARGLTMVAGGDDPYPIAALAELISAAASLAGDPDQDATVHDLWTATVAAIAAPGAPLRAELPGATAAARSGDPAPLRAIAADLAPIPGLAGALAR